MKQLRHTIQHHNLHMQAPVRLSHINLYHCDTPTSDVFPGHPYAKLIFVQKGSGQLHYENYHISFQTGTLILMNPERQKFSIQIDENPTDIVILGIEYLYFIRNENIFEQPYVIRQCPSDLYSFFISQIVTEVQTQSLSFEDVCNHYMELLLIFLQRDTHINCTSFMEDKSSQDCQNIKDYLDEHYAENITLDTLSEESGMNKYYLVHSFTKKYIRSPISYLNEKRIDESKKLLENTDYSSLKFPNSSAFPPSPIFHRPLRKKL